MMKIVSAFNSGTRNSRSTPPPNRPAFHRTRGLFGHLVTVAAVLVLLASFLLVGLRLALPHADGLRDAVAVSVGDRLDTDVQVGSLALQLKGWTPRLTLRDVTLRHRHLGHSQLEFAGLRIALDPIASLRALRPRITGVTLIGAAVELPRGLDGHVRISGIGSLGGRDPAALGFFLREGRFGLADSRLYWTDLQTGQSTVELDIARLTLINEDRDHRLRLEGTIAGDPASRLDLVAVLRGPAETPANWSGKAHLHWQGGDLDRLIRSRAPMRLGIGTGSFAVESWVTLTAGRPEQVLSRLIATDVTLRRDAKGTQPVEIDDLSAWLRWRPAARGWTLQLADVRADGGSMGAIDTDVVVGVLGSPGHQDSEDQRRLLVAAQSLPLDLLRPIGGLLADLLPAELAPLLKGPVAGTANQLIARLPLGTDAPAWRLRGRLIGLGHPKVGPIPSVSGLDLGLDLTASRGRIRLDAEDAIIDLRPLMAAPTHLKRLEGTLGWTRMPGGSYAIKAADLLADTADVKTRSRLKLCAHPSGAGTFVDLITHLGPADVADVGGYLPVGIMDPRLVDWLNRALVGGHVTGGAIVFRGPLDAFPFDDQQGRFLIALNARDGILDYQPAKGDEPLSWPPLRDIAAELRFVNRSMEFDLQSARLLGAEVSSGRARLPDLWNPRHLHIEAKGRGPMADGLRILAETPLSRRLGGIARAFTGEGDLGLELGLDVPLTRGLRFDYDGTLHWRADDEAALALSGADVQLTGLDGSLHFDNSGVEADAIQGRIEGQAARVEVRTIPGEGDAPSLTRTRLSSHTRVNDLARHAPSPLWSLADGGVDWTLTIELDNSHVGTAKLVPELHLRSDLRGLALSLPPPLGKDAQTRMTLEVDGRLQMDRPATVATRLGQLGARFGLEPSARGPRLTRIAIDPDGEPPALPSRDGILIDGDLSQLELDPWLSWWDANGEALTSNATPSLSSLKVLPSRIKIGSLRWGAVQLTDTEIRLSADDGPWRIAFDAAQANGALYLPTRDRDTPLRIRLDRVVLDQLLTEHGLDEPERGDSRQPGQADDPRRIGPVDLGVEALHWRDADLGRLQASLRPDADGVVLQDLRLTSDLLTVEGRGKWRVDATEQQETRLSLDIKTEDLGKVLRATGLYPGLQRAGGTIKLSASWPGAPGELDLTRVLGKLEGSLGPGQLTEVDPGVGRLLGAINLSALERRLSLDFTDVTDDGLAFDAIDGRISLGGGTARIGLFEIAGPTADIRITGDASLTNDELDQTVRVTPKIGSGVALASAVAGGPLVGAAVFLADKATGGGVERLGSFEYRVTGPWGEPDIRRIGITEDLSSKALLGNGSPPTDASDPKEASSPPPSTRPDLGNPFLDGF
jgi:uncharacterized protein (TIGR02099 family)